MGENYVIPIARSFPNRPVGQRIKAALPLAVRFPMIETEHWGSHAAKEAV